MMGEDGVLFSEDGKRAFEQLATDAGYPCYEITLDENGAEWMRLNSYAPSLADANKWLRAIDDAA